jgi:trk system potassium uptake protein TrkA
VRSGKSWRPERVAVIGLGRFGTSTANELSGLGYEVTAIDIDERKVAAAAERVALAAQGDGTDEDLLRSLHVDRSDVGVVAQGTNLEASVLSTLLMKRIGVPWVVAKAKTDLHGELLARIGADRVIYPERDAGNRLAHSLSVRHISDYIENHYQLNLLLIKRGQKIIAVPSYRERIEEGDELVLVGPDREMAVFTESHGPRPVE